VLTANLEIGCRQGTSGFITDFQGNNRILYGIKQHIGGIRASSRTYTMGQDMDTRKWYNVDFNEIQTMEIYRADKDPITGMKGPLMSKITRQDGTLLD